MARITAADLESLRMPPDALGNPGLMDPNALQSVAWGTDYDVQARRNAIAAALLALQARQAQQAAASQPAATTMTPGAVDYRMDQGIGPGPAPSPGQGTQSFLDMLGGGRPGDFMQGAPPGPSILGQRATPSMPRDVPPSDRPRDVPPDPNLPQPNPPSVPLTVPSVPIPQARPPDVPVLPEPPPDDVPPDTPSTTPPGYNPTAPSMDPNDYGGPVAPGGGTQTGGTKGDYGGPATTPAGPSPTSPVTGLPETSVTTQAFGPTGLPSVGWGPGRGYDSANTYGGIPGAGSRGAIDRSGMVQDEGGGGGRGRGGFGQSQADKEAQDAYDANAAASREAAAQNAAAAIAAMGGPLSPGAMQSMGLPAGAGIPAPGEGTPGSPAAMGYGPTPSTAPDMGNVGFTTSPGGGITDVVGGSLGFGGGGGGRGAADTGAALGPGFGMGDALGGVGAVGAGMGAGGLGPVGGAVGALADTSGYSPTAPSMDPGDYGGPVNPGSAAMAMGGQSLADMVAAAEAEAAGRGGGDEGNDGEA